MVDLMLHTHIHVVDGLVTRLHNCVYFNIVGVVLCIVAPCVSVCISPYHVCLLFTRLSRGVV